MRSAPIDAAAGRTLFEIPLGPKNVFRHEGLNRFSRNGVQRAITLDATTQQPSRVDFPPQMREHLSDLRAELRAFNEEGATQQASLSQAGIASQCNASFTDASFHDLVIVDAVIVNGIVTEDPEPLGEGAEHDVG